MRKIFFALMSIAVIAIACHRKTIPVITERTVQPPPPPTSPEPVLSSPAIAAGKVIYTTKCTKCHNAKPVNNWTREEWGPILKSMVKKSKLDSLETSQVTLFVHEYAKK